MTLLFDHAGGTPAIHALEQGFYDSVLADLLLQPLFGRHLNITATQRERFVALYMAALERSGLPRDEPFVQAVREHVEFGTRVAQQNSRATTDDELHPLRQVPRWTWDGDGA